MLSLINLAAHLTIRTFLFNAALFVSVPLVFYDVVSHFTEANNISSSTNFGKDHMFFAISLYNFGFYPPCTVHIIFHFGYILDIVAVHPECRDHIQSLPTTHAFYENISLLQMSGWPVPNQLCCIILLPWNIVAHSRTHDGNLCDKLNQQQQKHALNSSPQTSILSSHFSNTMKAMMHEIKY